jgi:hypothetical protein
MAVLEKTKEKVNSDARARLLKVATPQFIAPSQKDRVTHPRNAPSRFLAGYAQFLCTVRRVGAGERSSTSGG